MENINSKFNSWLSEYELQTIEKFSKGASSVNKVFIK